ncbi:MAG: RNA helicase [Deltaproteobacteria bacterium HGW-Deltaproteobacteria-4]|nr:MAG: RNA helicase [Deltaproteobacteria bacterium HGW-Deltaproteobacteria-4]
MSFSSLGLSPSLLAAVTARQFLVPFLIQTQAIPAILAGRDLLALARTGSGKTASFILPLLQRLQESPAPERRTLKILVLVPTRELAMQIADFAQTISNYLPTRLKIRAVYGGVPINPQMTAVNGVDLLIATPGRLLDLLDKNALQLSTVETLVLDEADRLLDLGFTEELGRILALLPPQRQNLLFAATTGDYLQALAAPLLRDPLRIDLGTSSSASGQISQKIYVVSAARKGPLLRYLLKKGGWPQVLVFVSTKKRADNVAKKLADHGISAEAFHGDRTQGARSKALADFKEGKVRVLVATDLASRGIDIEGLPYVVNYELPRAASDYTHRIGRTGRAHLAGLAITLLAPEEFEHFQMIEKKLGQRCERIATDDVELTNF